MRRPLLLLALLIAGTALFGCVAQQQAGPTASPAITVSPPPTATTPTPTPTPASEEVPELNESLDQEIQNLTDQLG